MTEWDQHPEKIVRSGPDPLKPRWIMPTSGRDGLLHRVDFDVFFFKDVLAARLSQAAGTARWELYTPAAGTSHAMFAAHLCCEQPKPKSGSGRAVNIWELAGTSRDNHWFDTSVMTALAASIGGAVIPGMSVTPVPAKRVIRASDIQKQRGTYRL